MAKEQKVKAIMVIEIAGRPPEHVVETLKQHIGVLEKRKDVEYVSENISEPKLIDKEKKIYSCFAEVEIEVESLFKLMELIFDFMPSSVEVLEPDNLNLNTQEASMFLNDLSGRLHKYDEVMKIAQMRNQQIFQAYQQLQAQLAQNAKPKGDSKDTKKAKKKTSKKKK